MLHLARACTSIKVESSSRTPQPHVVCRLHHVFHSSADAQCAVRSTCRARKWRRCRAATSTTPTALRSGCSTKRCVDTAHSHVTAVNASQSEEDSRVVRTCKSLCNPAWCVPHEPDPCQRVYCRSALSAVRKSSSLEDELPA